MIQDLPKATEFRAYCILHSYRLPYNDGLWDWLTAEGFTQNSLPDKIKAADAAAFDWVLN